MYSVLGLGRWSRQFALEPLARGMCVCVCVFEVCLGLHVDHSKPRHDLSSLMPVHRQAWTLVMLWGKARDVWCAFSTHKVTLCLLFSWMLMCRNALANAPNTTLTSFQGKNDACACFRDVYASVPSMVDVLSGQFHITRSVCLCFYLTDGFAELPQNAHISTPNTTRIPHRGHIMFVHVLGAWMVLCWESLVCLAHIFVL
jgi:hypothetical protein